MKIFARFALCLLVSSSAFAEAVILKSGERYIGDLTEEGDSYRIKNNTFPDGILVRKDDVKTIYPKAEELLKRLGEKLDQAKSKYEQGKKSDDPNTFMKAAIELLFDPELEAAEAAEIYPSHSKEFAEVSRSIQELRKMCREAQNLGGGPVGPKPDPKPDPKPGDPKPDPKPDPAGPEKKPAAPKKDASEMTRALDTIKSGPVGELIATLRTFDEGKEERLCLPMIERLKTESDPQAKTVLKEALGKYPGFVVVRTVDNALKSKGVTDAFRLDCCEILSSKKEDKAISIITDTAFAGETRDTREVAKGILENYKNDCLKSVNRYIHHPDKRTRTEAVEFVASIGTEEAYGLLAACLLIGTDTELMKQASIDTALRDQCCDILVRAGDRACPALVKSLSGNTRKWAAFCLKKISGEDFVESDVKAWTTWWLKRKKEIDGN